MPGFLWKGAQQENSQRATFQEDYVTGLGLF